MKLNDALMIARKEMAETNLIMLDIKSGKMLPVQNFERAVNMAAAYNKLAELHNIL